MNQYAETMDRLKRPKSWDVLGIIADVAERLKADGDGEAVAVIDTLLFRLQDANECLNGNYKDAEAIRRVSDLVKPFARPRNETR